MRIPLEDNVWDVLGKAQRGLGLTEGQLLLGAGVSLPQWRALEQGKAGQEERRSMLGALARVLGLNGAALVGLAEDWEPREQRVDGVTGFNTCFGAMTVNAYLLWDPNTGHAAAVDTGADADPMLDFLRQEQLSLKWILLTHSHGDHIYELDRLKQKTGAEAWIGEREPVEGARTFREGKTFPLGSLQIDTRLTWGHSQGGITYVASGLRHPVAFVGDALFAGSMGGAKVSYEEALRTNRREIFTLPDETLLCPGHGPMSTVGEEKEHNPFFV